MPSIIHLATTAALITVENTIPNVSGLVKKQIMMPKYHTLRINISAHLHNDKFKGEILNV